MESISQVTQVEQPQANPGCLSEVGWFFSGAVLPMGSLSFYRKAAQKSVGSAMLFFFVFTSIITCLITASAAIALYSATSDIQKAYQSGKIPEITISNGVAEVTGQQPIILLDGTDSQGQRMLIAVDTTGKLTEIDQSRYDQGFLLTRTDLHILNQGKYQAVPLSEINKAFNQDPLIINADTATQAWGAFSAIIAVVMLVFLWLWHFVFRLMVIAIYALVLWGIVSMMRSGTGFAPIIISGLYAVVPAIYISHLFSRSGFTFPGVQTFFLLIFWIIGLIASLMDHPLLKAERPLRGWTALIGVPMLIVFIIDSITAIPAPYGVPILWAVFILTFLVLAGVRVFFRFQESQTPTAAAPSL